MSQLMVVTGGAKSGKSVFAEKQLSRSQHICYLATGVMKRPDPEMKLRIMTHQKRRPDTWHTEERYRDVAGFITAHHFDGFLLDDATMLITNLFYDDMLARAKQQHVELDALIESLSRDDLNAVTTRMQAEWQHIVVALRKTDQNMIIVTNEVGLGIVPATKQTRVLRDLYGQVNQWLAQAADSVYFVISGLPQRLK
ncbi:bifunctional adenosylcobinamide kinase/adenosylcobinamide-phosphate guanylyltransferase [Secundilactobacillus hailunensis]|uniref:Adenosylcobinamide kinase n=1 Tax=Secundilactobacillus hailunensis TaxID=2559923 RepID=A0ABW1T8W8_9LACO|nr:bifunctional adenosylcobinamide kinase/adenosylcobinamide-phosphate guanylyltransferase [Secundilactobacillus hailunensis]